MSPHKGRRPPEAAPGFLSDEAPATAGARAVRFGARRPSCPARHRQTFDERGRQMAAHQHPHEGVEHVTVEQGAEKMLLLDRDPGAQAEERARGRGLGWNDGRDERLAIRHAGDIAIREALAREAAGSDALASDLTIDTARRRRDVGGKWPDMLASSTGRPVEPKQARSSVALSSRPNSTRQPSADPRRGWARVSRSSRSRSPCRLASGMRRALPVTASMRSRDSRTGTRRRRRGRRAHPAAGRSAPGS